MKCLKGIKLFSGIIFIGTLIINVYKYINNIEIYYLNYVFWISIFIYFISSIGADILKKANKNKE